MADWEIVAVYPNRAIAEMMREMLENEGVAAVISVDDAGGLRPELAYTLGVKLRVPKSELERAKEILTPEEPGGV